MLSGKHIIREKTFSVFCNSGKYIFGNLHSGYPRSGNHRRVNGDAAKKPHIEAVATNGNGHTNGN